jgi:lysozyme family protein
MTPFDKALAVTLAHEGGVSDHAADRGGLTKWGVTQATYETWRASTGQAPRPVVEMTEAEMRAIYLDLYWMPARCDELPDELAGVVFDMAVNSGVRRAVITLQRVLGVTQDGIPGPETISAAHEAGPMVALTFLKARAALYRDIVRNDPTQIAFLAGWVARLLDLAWRRS